MDGLGVRNFDQPSFCVAQPGRLFAVAQLFCGWVRGCRPARREGFTSRPEGTLNLVSALVQLSIFGTGGSVDKRNNAQFVGNTIAVLVQQSVVNTPYARTASRLPPFAGMEAQLVHRARIDDGSSFVKERAVTFRNSGRYQSNLIAEFLCEALRDLFTVRS